MNVLSTGSSVDTNPTAIAPQGPQEPPRMPSTQPNPPNEPWFCDKPEPLPKLTLSLFPADDPNPIPQQNLQSFSHPDYVQRVSSSRVPEDSSHVKLEQLANMLNHELNGTRRWDVPGLLENLFSDEVLGIPVRNLNLVNNSWLNIIQITVLGPRILDGLKKTGLIHNGAFTTRLDSQESNIADFLNSTARALEEILRKMRRLSFDRPTLRRLWSSEWFDRVMSGSPIFRKPDLMLLDMPLPNPQSSSPSSKVSWANIKAVGEVTLRPTFHRDLKNTIDAKTYILFLTQHDRNFVPTISFFGSYFILSITDRQSQQFSKLLLLHDENHSDDIMLFVRVLLGLMFSPDHVLGLDTTMIRNSEDKIASIFVGTKRYEVIKPLYSVQSLLGRGTKVWQVQCEGKIYVLNDSWVIATRRREDSILHALKSIEGIPKLISGAVVAHPEFTKPGRPAVALRTSLFRFDNKEKLGTRERRRVVEGPEADPLSSFQSRLEVLVAFRDYVYGGNKFNLQVDRF